MSGTLTSKQQNKELCPSNLDYCFLFFFPEVAQEDVTKKTLLERIRIPHMPCQTLQTNSCEKKPLTKAG